MPRIREINEAGATDEQRALFDGDVERFGSILNTTRVYAHRPEFLPHLQALTASLTAAGTLGPGLVSLTRLRIAQIIGCPC